MKDIGEASVTKSVIKETLFGQWSDYLLLPFLFLFFILGQLRTEKDYHFASDGTQAVWQPGLFRSRCE